jgi:HupE/UreJ protein
VRILAAVALSLLASRALAHDPSRSLLTLDVETAAIHGRLDVSLRDLEDAVGLDDDGDRAITWSEVSRRRAEVERYVQSKLAFRADEEPCVSSAVLGGIDRHAGAVYAVLEIEGACAAQPRRLRVDYGLMFDVDSAHRSLVAIGSGGAATTAVLSAEHHGIEVDVASLTPAAGFARFAEEGVWHIWHGYDHLAFVLLLLVPIVFVAPRDRAPMRLRDAVFEILRVVTAFTAAHSLTLALATLGAVTVPTRFVESAIALSVLIAALANVVPRAPRLGARLAFCFGLVHGLGFASALSDLGTESVGAFVSLAGFNLGVEAGQLVVVAAALPALFAVRAHKSWPTVVRWSCSAACAGLAVVWLSQRLAA